MKLFAMTCGRLRCRKNIFVPNIDKGEVILSPMPVFLITHPKGYVLFDTGPSPDVFENAAGYWGGLAKALEPIGDDKSGILSQLKSIGFAAEHIKYVINSHLHSDHAGGNRFFPHSTIIISAKEMECAMNPEYEGRGYIRLDWDHPLNYCKIEGELDVYGDGSLIIIPMPGHTLGHQIMLVRLPKQGNIILSGDSVPCQENFLYFTPSRTNMDNKEALTSIEKLHQLVDEKKAFLICGHDPVQWEMIKRAPEFYS